MPLTPPSKMTDMGVMLSTTNPIAAVSAASTAISTPAITSTSTANLTPAPLTPAVTSTSTANLTPAVTSASTAISTPIVTAIPIPVVTANLTPAVTEISTAANINYVDIFDVIDPDEEAMKQMEDEISKIISESEKKNQEKMSEKKGINSFEEYLSFKSPCSPPPRSRWPRQRLYDDEDDDDIFRPQTKVPVYVEDDDDNGKYSHTSSTTRMFDGFDNEIKDEGKLNEIHDEIMNMGAIIHNLCSQVKKNHKIISTKLDKMDTKITLLNDKIDNIEKRLDDVQVEMEQGMAVIENKFNRQSHHPGVV